MQTVLSGGQVGNKMPGLSFAELLAIVDAPALVLDEAFRVQCVNNAFVESFGLKREDVLSKCIDDLGGLWSWTHLRHLLESKLAVEGIIENAPLTVDSESDRGLRFLVHAQYLPHENDIARPILIRVRRDVPDGVPGLSQRAFDATRMSHEVRSSMKVLLGTTHIAQTESDPITSTPPRSLAILFAEDIPANQKLVTSILQSHSHHVTIAKNGCEAVEHVLAGGFDVVLMDVRMPEMDGYQATEAIRKAERLSGKHVPIIAMTANATNADRERCRAAGMDAYLSKPIDIDELVEAIHRSVGWDTTVPATVNDQSVAPRSEESERVLNLGDAMKRLHGDRDLFREFVEVFDEDAPRLLYNLRDALAKSDFDGLSKAAHSLRGLAVNLGADMFQRLAVQLESECESANLHSATLTVARMMDAFARLNQELEGFR
ncbi:MAG: response regulator [Planctomycetota bacterium]